MTEPMTARLPNPTSDSVRAEVMAWTGEMRVARAAGSRAATSVTRMPVTSEATMALTPRVSVVCPMSHPVAAMIALMATARPRPPNRPRTDPTAPTTRASTRTVALI